MKKISALLFALMLLSLTGCSAEQSKEKSSKDTKASHEESEDSQDNKKKDDEKKDSTDANTSSEDGNVSEDSKEEKDKEKDNSSKKENNKISFSEVIAVDNAECTIKITDIDPDNLWGYSLKTTLENKSSDKTYMFSVDSASINGVQCDPFFASEVASGKKSNEEISFTTDTLDENGIGDYTDIELSFRVYDNDDWLADPVAEETVHVYPYGEEKASTFVREAQASDNILIDNDYITAIATGYEEDDLWGYTVNLFLINKTNNDVMFSVDEASVNNIMCDPFFAETVSAGKCSFSSMSFSDTTLEKNGIETIEEIEFKLHAYNADDFMSDEFANESITLNP
ncbi:MAG: hypothetical protein IKK47_01525 [Ruminococcus sp.]|nr:hypothetical protein [Ruminococcus sp.]